MDRTVRLGLLLIFLSYVCMFEHANAKCHNVESALKRLEDIESKLMENQLVQKEVNELKAVVNKQKHALQESAETVSNLENIIESLFKIKAEPWELPRSTKHRAVLKIEKGTSEEHISEKISRNVTGPIAFMAYMKRFHTSNQYPPGAILPFEMTTLNTGSFYNKTSGLFTCPTSGLYKLDWALAYYYPNNTGTSTGTGSAEDDRGYTLDVDFVIVYLNRSDTAGVTNPDDNGVFVPYLSKFSGFKI